MKKNTPWKRNTRYSHAMFDCESDNFIGLDIGSAGHKLDRINWVSPPFGLISLKASKWIRTLNWIYVANKMKSFNNFFNSIEYRTGRTNFTYLINHIQNSAHKKIVPSFSFTLPSTFWAVFLLLRFCCNFLESTFSFCILRNFLEII